MDSDGLDVRRPEWSERWGRPGWQLLFTTAGGRLRDGDPFASIASVRARGVQERFVSQACLALPATSEGTVDPTIELWASLARKILQRARRPPVSERASDVLMERLAERRDWMLPAVLDRAMAGPLHNVTLADEYALHETYEQPLWDTVERVAPGLRRWLVPQASLEALAAAVLPQEVAARWVDFVYAPPWLVQGAVIEIDGEGHARKEGVDRERDKAVRASGLKPRRYVGRTALDPAADLMRSLANEALHLAGPVDPLALVALHGPATVTRLALAFVEAVRAGWLPPGRPWSVSIADEIGVASELVGAALDPLRAIADVWGPQIVPDEIWVDGKVWQVETGITNRQTRSGTAPDLQAKFSFEPTVPYFARLPAIAALPELVVRGVGAPVDLPWLPTTTTVRPRLAADVDIEAPLTLLLRDLFGHERFQPGQLRAIRRTLEGEDTVVLLPTGSGKSLIYQLGGLLLPGTTLVVDPLVSLIKDQAERLQRSSIERVAALHSSQARTPQERDEILRSVADGSALFAFITPERLQIQRFRDHLRAATQRQLVGLTVVDEAHCVSEWGHDFRTAYLRLARTLRERCAAPNGEAPPLLALTGTASPSVLRDVLRELVIDGSRPEALQSLPSHDRPNLHYRLVKTENPMLQSQVIRCLLDEVPEFHTVDAAQLVAPAGDETLSGIVFAPHVNGDFGTESLARLIRDSFKRRGIRLEAVTYSGRPPKGHKRHEWDALKGQAEFEFKSNKATMLIGTKAFGMGIDKANIRYTVHAGFPASAEAFAQEAGRAGRTPGQQAVCILVAANPDADQAQRLLDLEIPAEIRAKRVKAVSRQDASDLSRQLYFLTKSYPGHQEEARRVSSTFELLRAEGGRPGAVVTLLNPIAWTQESSGEDDSDNLLRSLYRLSMLGVVDDMTVDNDQVNVFLADYTRDTVDAAWLDYVMRVEPGRGTAHERRLAAAPAELNSRIDFLAAALVEVVYSVVARSRILALQFMHRLASGDSDPKHLRSEINAYLSQGPVAMVLSEAVTGDTSIVDVARFVRAMDLIPIQDQQHLVAESARQLEAYPDHPLLLVASALGEVRSRVGDEAAFASTASRAIDQMRRYEVSDGDRAAAVSWLVRKVLREQPGKRTWVRHVLRTWYDAEYRPSMLEPIEDAVLEDAAAGDWDPGILELVRTKRLQRRSGEVKQIVDRVAPVPVER